MRGTLAFLCILSLWPLATCAPFAAAQDRLGAIVDFDLEEETGTHRTLHEVRGKVVILFYENREQAPLTRAFKLSLGEFVRQGHLEDRIRTYGVANLSGVPSAVRSLARAVVAQVAQRNHVHVLMDWNGTLQRAPFSLPDAQGSVVLIDASGRIRHRLHGVPSDGDRRAFYRILRELLRTPM